MRSTVKVKSVSLPYGFTLFSNISDSVFPVRFVSLPYGFTLFSNLSILIDLVVMRFTTLWIYTILKPPDHRLRRAGWFHYLMDLHYSQTSMQILTDEPRFTTLWIYTILKLQQNNFNCNLCFTTLWIYTILKLVPVAALLKQCFTTLWIYTILKRLLLKTLIFLCFTTLWIYTILKPDTAESVKNEVSLPYGFTLFSNSCQLTPPLPCVSLPYGFTLFSNTVNRTAWAMQFHYLMDLHYSQTL